MAIEYHRVEVALLEAVPELVGLVEAHVRDYGGLHPYDLFAELARHLGSALGERGGVVGQVVDFMNEAFTSGDERVRELVARGFIARVVAWQPSRAASAFISTWPVPLRQEAEQQRAARRSIAHGVVIEARDDLHQVGVLWVVRDDLEAVAADDAVVYIVGSEVHAVRARDGRLLWRSEHPEGGVLEASGGVMIGKDHDGNLEIFAPFEYYLRLDRQTGVPLTWDFSSPKVPPPNFTPLLPPPVRDVEVRSREGGRVEIRARDGRLLATITVESPSFDELPALQVGAVVVLPLSSGDVVGLGRWHTGA